MMLASVKATWQFRARAFVLISMLVVASAVSAKQVTFGQVSSPLIIALRHGKAARVRRLERVVHVGPIMHAMITAQLHYDMRDLLASALLCQRKALSAGISGKSAGYLNAARYCSYVAQIAELKTGSVTGFLNEIYWIKIRLFPAVLKIEKQHLVFGTTLDTIDASNVVMKTKQTTHTWSSKDGVLRRIKSKNGYRVNISINGNYINAYSQPLAGASNTPITVVEPLSGVDNIAKTLRLTPVISRYAIGHTKYRGTSYRLRMDLDSARSVKVGPLVLHNVAVNVIRSDYLPPGVSIGLPVWHEFGEVVIEGHAVRVSRLARHGCAPATPLTYASELSSAGVLQFQAKLNGVDTTAAFFATGDYGVARTSRVPARVHGAPSARGPANGNVRTGAATVRVGDQVLHYAHIRSIAVGAPFQIALGGRLLDSHAVYLRFGGTRPTICLVPDVHRASGRELR